MAYTLQPQQTESVERELEAEILAVIIVRVSAGRGRHMKLEAGIASGVKPRMCSMGELLRNRQDCLHRVSSRGPWVKGLVPS